MMQQLHHWRIYAGYHFACFQAQQRRYALSWVFFLGAAFLGGLMMPSLPPSMIMIALGLLVVFTLTLSTEGYWAHHYTSGVLEAHRFLPLSLGAQVVIHYGVLVVGLVLPLVGVTTLMAMMSAPLLEALFLAVGLVFLGSLMVSLLLMLQALMSSGARNAKFLVLLLGLPFMTPLCLVTLGWAVPNESVWAHSLSGLGFLVGLFFVYVPCTLASTVWILKHLHP